MSIDEVAEYQGQADRDRQTQGCAALDGQGGGEQVNKPEDACGRWPECRCVKFCDYWSGPTLEPVEDDD